MESTRTAHIVIRHAASHATSEIDSPSASSSLTMRTREAPSDCRTAVSRCRAMLRASIKFATLAETISTVSSVTIEKSARKAGMMAGTTPPAVAA